MSAVRVKLLQNLENPNPNCLDSFLLRSDFTQIWPLEKKYISGAQRVFCIALIPCGGISFNNPEIWHTGVHMTKTSVPLSVRRGRNSDSLVALMQQCIGHTNLCAVLRRWSGWRGEWWSRPPRAATPLCLDRTHVTSHAHPSQPSSLPAAPL